MSDGWEDVPASGDGWEDVPSGGSGGLATNLAYGSQGANSGIAEVLGAPVDLVNAALKKIGLGSDHPFLGSETHRNWMNSLTKSIKEATGVGNPEMKAAYDNINEVPVPYRPSARAGEVAGSTLGLVLPMAGASRAGELLGAPFGLTGRTAAETMAPVAPSGSALRNVGRDVMREARVNPSAFMASQLPASVGQGAGALAAETLAPGSLIGQMVGQLGGGLLGSTLTAGVRAGAGPVSNGINKITEPFASQTDEGVKNMAARALSPLFLKQAENPKAAIDLLRQQPIAPGLVAGERAQSPVLTGVQQYLARDNTDLANAVTAGGQKFAQNLKQGFAGSFEPGDPAALTKAAGARQQSITDQINGIIGPAEQRAQEAVRAITPNSVAERTGLNVKARDILEGAVTRARSTETALWNRIDKGTPVDTSNTAQTYKDIRSQMLPDASLPPLIEQSIARFTAKNATPTFGDLQKLRSEALNQQRALNSGLNPDRAMGRRMGDLASGVLNDMSAIDNPAAGVARDYSRALNERLTRSYAGDIMGTKGTGAERIRPELTLERATSGNPEQVAQQLKELQTAAVPLRVSAAEAPTAMDAAKQMQETQQQFLRSVSEKVIDPATGTVKPAAVDSFMRDNAAILDQFPQYRKSLELARDRQAAFNQITSATGDALKTAQKTGAFSRVLAAGEKPADAVKGVINGPTPIQDMTRLATLARSGGQEAVDGLRATVLQHVMNEAETAGRFSYGKARGILLDPLAPNGPSILQTMRSSGIVNTTQQAQIQRFLDAGLANEASKVSGIDVKSFGTEPGMLGKAAARIFGAKLAERVAGGGGAGPSLQVASIGAGMAEKIAAKLPADRAKQFMAKALAAENPADLIDILERAAISSGFATGPSGMETSRALVLMRASIPRDQSDAPQVTDRGPNGEPSPLEMTITRPNRR